MFSPLSNRQSKQFIDADQCWTALQDARRRANSYRGSMYWRESKGRDYLTREISETTGSTYKSLGVRSPETEKIFTEFRKNKEEAEIRLKSLKSAMEDHRRINSALRVGRVPNVVIGIIEILRKAGLQDNFLVIGTNALYAYESQAGGRFSGDITATTDVDFLWDSRKKITLASDSDAAKIGLIGLLKKVDSSFQVLKDYSSRAANSDGYLVDLVKPRPLSLFNDHEPQQVFPNEDDFWASKIRDMHWMLSSPKFREVVVGENGRMAEMVTVDPRAFVLQKAWTSQKDERDQIKKKRDIEQAQAVFWLIQKHLPHLSFEKIHVFPESIRSRFIEFNQGTDGILSEKLKI